ncbi:MAG: hypothetical protein I8H71_12810 [Xanthomonadaceae bacterium]|nr:hypothetical protein [Xanthomonadaceae bacterium]
MFIADKLLAWRCAARLEKNSKYLIGKRKIEEVLRSEFQARHAGLMQLNLAIIRFAHKMKGQGKACLPAISFQPSRRSRRLPCCQY